jgi:RHS repeat-associated protein
VIGEHVGSTSYYYLHDNLGSVVAVISASGAVQDRDAYDPYGNITSSSGTLSNPIGYVSGYIDSATGLVQFGARYYNPGVGLFTQEDPSGQSIGYLYVGDDPVNGTDPSGMSGNPVDVDCSGGGTAAACAGAEAIAEQVTAEECANNPGACSTTPDTGNATSCVGDVVFSVGGGLFAIFTSASGVGVFFGGGAAAYGVRGFAAGDCDL